MATKAERVAMSIGYYARVIVQDGMAKGRTEASIRRDVLYCCEVSEVLNASSHVEKIMDVGYGRAVA